MSDLRARLATGASLPVPGIADALQARLVAQAGFEALFLSGAGVSFSLLGRPDVGLVNQVEMTERIARITDTVDLPLLADGDNGHGNALNVIRTVRDFERAGAAGIMLEDQVFPKRCGHLAGTRLISTEEMVGKIRAAVDTRRSASFQIIGRTDARGVEGLDAAIERAHQYREAGADIIFVEAPRSEAELARVGAAFPGVPLVANMVEGGKTPQLDNARLNALGHQIVFYPSTVLRISLFAAQHALAELARQGTTAHLRDQMIDFSALNALVGLDEVQALESTYVRGGPADSEQTS